MRRFLGVAMVVGLAGPVAAQAPDRSGPPPVGPPPSLRLPPVQRFELPNGLPVVLMEKRGVPLVQVELLVRSGTAADPADRPGIASMTAEMLDEGAGTRNALELADAIDFLGASIGATAGRHATTVALHAPLERFAPALNLMADIALRPTFDAAELDRQRASRITTLLQWHDEPRAVAAVLYDRTLYGVDHPYGRSSLGTAESLRALTATDLRAFHDAHFRPNHATLVVVGAIARAEAEPVLAEAFGAWAPGAVSGAEWPTAPRRTQREVFLVDKPGAAQSEILIGRVGVARTSDDYFPLLVLNTILGGSFTSRLNQNLREDKGYTYGARSAFAFRPHPGPFTASAAVQTFSTDSALVEFMRELRRIREPVSTDELERAKRFLAFRYLGGFESVAQMAGQLGDLVEFDLPETYFDDYVDRVMAVSADAVQQAARRLIDPDRMAVVVVGDRAEIEAGIRGLELGPLHVLDVVDVLGPPPNPQASPNPARTP